MPLPKQVGWMEKNKPTVVTGLICKTTHFRWVLKAACQSHPISHLSRATISNVLSFQTSSSSHPLLTSTNGLAAEKTGALATGSAALVLNLWRLPSCFNSWAGLSLKARPLGLKISFNCPLFLLHSLFLPLNWIIPISIQTRCNFVPLLRNKN